VFDFLIERGRAADFTDAKSQVGKLSGCPLPRVSSTDRRLPTIQAKDRQLRELVADAWTAVHAANSRPDLYARTGFLVRLVPAEGGPRIEILNEDRAYGLLARVANWVRPRGKLMADTLPVRDVAKDILAYPDERLPKLERVCFAPIFDAAGNLVITPGYQAAARVWLHLPEGFELAPILDAPSSADVATARRLILNDLLVDFPFAGESDRAHAVAALLLPFARNLIYGPTPIHDIESPAPGSGKGLLADLVSILALGRRCHATTITRDEDESRKKITSMLDRGQSLILLDNIRGGLESSSLASAITAETWSDRILGVSRMVDLPNRATWVVTANNPRFSLEIARRCIRIRLNPKVDRPWQRKGFKHPMLLDWTLKHRGDFVWALLVLVRAWLAARRPSGTRSLGSFESYASVMGGIFDVSGIPGFLHDVEQLYEQADAESREWRALVTAWWESHGPVWVTAGDLHRLATDKELLGQVLGEKNDRSQKIRLGIALQGMRDRQFGRFRIVSEPDSNAGAARYRLVEVDAVGTDGR
jgi:hypothetical protein